MATVNCLFTNILHIVLFCAQCKKEAQTVLEQLEDELIMTQLTFLGELYL